MLSQRRAAGWWLAGGLLAALIGAAIIVRADIAQRRQLFLAEARTAHRILSQAATGLDAVLGTLALLAVPSAAGRVEPPIDRLPALHPEVLGVWRRDGGQPWTEPAAGILADAERRSSAAPVNGRHAVLAAVDPARRHYTLVLATPPASFAMQVDAAQLIRREEWPWPGESPVRVSLVHELGTLLLQPGAAPGQRPGGLTQGFEMNKPLASTSQPFVLHAQLHTGPAQWPWQALAAWVVFLAALLWLTRRSIEARRERRRTAELMRLAQVSKLNTLGELAAGIAHELNQPLTAVLASTQTALRVLRDDGNDAEVAIQALELGTGQARRAAEVLARLRRLVQQPGAPGAVQAVDLRLLAREVVDLVSNQPDTRSITVDIVGDAPPALGDPVAIEQILHNLLGNAVHALEQSPHRPRKITIELTQRDGRVRCEVRDNGPGIAADALPHLFEPFYTTRAGGLGLGLPLCQSLALAMDGTIEASNVEPHGAAFVLDLPSAATPRARS